MFLRVIRRHPYAKNPFDTLYISLYQLQYIIVDGNQLRIHVDKHNHIDLTCTTVKETLEKMEAINEYAALDPLLREPYLALNSIEDYVPNHKELK